MRRLTCMRSTKSKTVPLKSNNVEICHNDEKVKGVYRNNVMNKKVAIIKDITEISKTIKY